jgi:hypothetical protein
MKTKVLCGVMTLLVCSAASADELGARLAGGAQRAPAAVLYLEFPLAARHRERPVFGLRVEHSARANFADIVKGRPEHRAASLDVPFNKRRDSEDAQALNLIGKPVIVVGIIAGALLVANALDDDDDGGGGGGY